MNVWYLSEVRFKARIINRWKKSKFIYNYGHIQLLTYSYRTLLFWSIIKRKKISVKNQDDGYPKLF